MSHPRFHLVSAAIVFPLVFICIAVAAYSQLSPGGAISGRVVDATTGLPLENANVFLAHTALGASTDEDGNFRIARIPAGSYRLVVSRVGYQMQTQSITLGESESFRREFAMFPKVLLADEVTVSGSRQSSWKKYLSDFTKKFLGTSDNASFCRIINPEVIAFGIDSVSHDLVASSDQLIKVENRALGYRVNIALEQFTWDLRRDIGQYLIYPEFEPIETQNLDTLQFWEKNREDNYQESLQHFFCSLINGTLEKEHFEVNAGTLTFLKSGSRRGIVPGDIIVQPTELWGMKRVMFSDWLMVEYDGENGKVTNFVALDRGAALVDSLGNVSDPLSVHTIGPWQERRVSDMLPLFWTRRHPGGDQH